MSSLLREEDKITDKYSVYCHKFPDGKVYIGLTKQDPVARWGCNGTQYKKQPVYEAIQYFGWNNIEHIIVADNLSKEEAQKLEIDLINEYNSIDDGYNVSKGGGLGGNPWVMIEYNGELYSPDELAKISPVEGLSPHDITTRVNNHGWDLEKALLQPKMVKNQLFFYNGSYYTAKELAELSDTDGITAAVIHNRICKHGWDVHRAITQPTNVKRQPHGIGTCRFEYNGKFYNSYELCQLSDIEDLTPLDITTRINKHGWSVERAITQPKKKMNLLFSYHGKMYNSHELAEISNVEGLTYHDITDRIRNGWSVEKAVETPKAGR